MSQPEGRLSQTSMSQHQIVPVSYPPAEVVIVGETGGSLSEAFRKRQKLLGQKSKSTKDPAKIPLKTSVQKPGKTPPSKQKKEILPTTKQAHPPEHTPLTPRDEHLKQQSSRTLEKEEIESEWGRKEKSSDDDSASAEVEEQQQEDAVPIVSRKEKGEVQGKVGREDSTPVRSVSPHDDTEEEDQDDEDKEDDGVGILLGEKKGEQSSEEDESDDGELGEGLGKGRGELEGLEEKSVKEEVESAPNTKGSKKPIQNPPKTQAAASLKPVESPNTAKASRKPFQNDDDVMKAMAAIGQSFGLENKEFYLGPPTPGSANSPGKSKEGFTNKQSPQSDTSSLKKSLNETKQPVSSPRENPADLLKKRMDYGKKAGTSLRQQIVEKIIPKSSLASPKNVTAEGRVVPEFPVSNMQSKPTSKKLLSQPVPKQPTLSQTNLKPSNASNPKPKQSTTSKTPGVQKYRKDPDAHIPDIALAADKAKLDQIVRKGDSIAGREKIQQFDAETRKKLKSIK